MLRRSLRVLVLVFQPLGPAARFGAFVRIAITLIVTGALSFGPFLTEWWTWERAVAAVLAVLALLSLRAGYQLQADNEVLLEGTDLQNHLAREIREGTELLRRIKRQRGAEIWTDLSNAVIDWGGSAITDTNELAPDIAEPLLAAGQFGPDTRDRKENLRYVKRVLDALKKVARQLR